MIYMFRRDSYESSYGDEFNMENGTIDFNSLVSKYLSIFKYL